MGNETYVDHVLIESSAYYVASTKFHLDREQRFIYGFSVEKLVLLSFADILVSRDRVGKIKVLIIFRCLYFGACAMRCQG